MIRLAWTIVRRDELAALRNRLDAAEAEATRLRTERAQDRSTRSGTVELTADGITVWPVRRHPVNEGRPS